MADVLDELKQANGGRGSVRKYRPDVHTETGQMPQHTKVEDTQADTTTAADDAYARLLAAIEKKKANAGGRGRASTSNAEEAENLFRAWGMDGSPAPLDAGDAEEDADALKKQNLRNMRQATGVSTAVVTREGGTDGGGIDGGGTEGPGIESGTIGHNTEFYKKHLPKELHNDPWALEEAAKDAAAIDYNRLMAANNGQAESSTSAGIDSDGDGIDEPFERLVFETGEVFFVSEDGTLILRSENEEN